MKKIELVEDIDRIKKRWSVQIVKIGAAVFTAWGALAAAGLTSTVPPWVPQAVAALGFVGAFVAAYLAQPNLPPATEKDETP
jgi:hypothetical protein